MKKIKSNSLFKLTALSLVLLSFASCKKDASAENAAADINQSTIAGTQAIAISGTGSDSIYIVGTCAARHRTDSVAFSSLPSAVATYLDANYAGYTFKKAFTDKDAAGTVSGYVVVVMYNDKPVGLRFDATGAFVRVLEQREGRDMSGRGFHPGGHFDDRDGLRRDSIAISALPSSVTAYLSANYGQDTLVRAFKGKDSSIIVLSTNNGAYATVFNASGTFVKRSALPSHPGRPTSITQDALPAAATTYLSTTYPNYVFKHAFKMQSNGTTIGYAVFIDANGTKYGLQFDASGNFVKAITVR